MEDNCYKIVRIVYKNIFSNSIPFDKFADDLGYCPDFLMKILKGEIPVSEKELESICNYLQIERKELIEDDEFKKLKGPLNESLNLLMDSIEEHNKKP